MANWQDYISRRYESLPILRSRLSRAGGNSRELTTHDKKYLNFFSNDYLGLATNPEIIEAFTKATKVYGVGSMGAATLGGYTKEHYLLSNEIASWLGFDRCLLFGSGFQLNVGIYSQLVDSNINIWLDKNSHASHIDGILLSKARFSTFSDENIDATITKIQNQPEKLHLILSEGSFSMDGTCKYLHKLIDLKNSCDNNVLLIIDDAHGVGALGANGFGTLEQLGLPISAIDLYIGTFGKAFGTHGGFVCGNNLLIEYLQQSVRSQIYSTYLPPSIAAATRKSLQVIKATEGAILRENLSTNISFFSKLTLEAGLKDANSHNMAPNNSPIQLLIYNNHEQLEQDYRTLGEHNILVGKIKYPTVPKDKPRLRVSLNALHHKTDIEHLISHLSHSRIGG